MSHLHIEDKKPLKTYKLTGMRKKALQMMKGGIRLSELKGLRLGLGTSLRTRISELRAMGYDIKDEWCKSGEAKYKEYFMVAK